MPVIKVFEDNIHSIRLKSAKDRMSRLFSSPSGRQTAQGRERPVYHATLDNDRGRVINVTWQDKGMFNRLVTEHAPFLRRMFGQPDVYRLDDCIAAPRFASEEGA